MTKNNAVFYVENEGLDRRFRTDRKELSIYLKSRMWIRHYAEDGTCTILRDSSVLSLVGIDSDEVFEEFKAIEGRLVIIDLPYFIVRSTDNNLDSDPIYTFDEALDYVNNYIQSNE